MALLNHYGARITGSYGPAILVHSGEDEIVIPLALGISWGDPRPGLHVDGRTALYLTPEAGRWRSVDGVPYWIVHETADEIVALISEAIAKEGADPELQHGEPRAMLPNRSAIVRRPGREVRQVDE